MRDGFKQHKQMLIPYLITFFIYFLALWNCGMYNPALESTRIHSTATQPHWVASSTVRVRQNLLRCYAASLHGKTFHFFIYLLINMRAKNTHTHQYIGLLKFCKAENYRLANLNIEQKQIQTGPTR